MDFYLTTSVITLCFQVKLVQVTKCRGSCFDSYIVSSTKNVSTWFSGIIKDFFLHI